MSGLVVLVAYQYGQEFYVDDEHRLADGHFVYDPGNGEWDAQFTGVVVAPDATEDKDEIHADPFTRFVLNPHTGKREQAEFARDDSGDWRFVLKQEDSIAYLPLFVETKDEDLALMAVATAASGFVAFPSTWESEQTWQERDYSGTLEDPGIELPDIDAAYNIPEPGDCFCCAELEDYEVLTPAQMIEWLKRAPKDFLLEEMIHSKEEGEEFWQQLNDWSVRNLNYALTLEPGEADEFLSEAIKALRAGIEQANSQFEGILKYLKEVRDEPMSSEFKQLRREGRMVQRQLKAWSEHLLSYVTEPEVDEDFSEEESNASLSIASAIEQLREPILLAREKGYSYQEIASLLETKGITVNASTLRSYLNQ